jgi:ABC-type transporter Mla subunit MlaD
MITLEQIRLLESKITRALELIRVLKDENSTLRKGLESAQRRMRELETLVDGFKTDQKEIESVIVRTLHNLDELEESAAAGGGPAAAAGGTPAATTGSVHAPTASTGIATAPASATAHAGPRAESAPRAAGGPGQASAGSPPAESTAGEPPTGLPSSKEELDIF